MGRRWVQTDDALRTSEGLRLLSCRGSFLVANTRAHPSTTRLHTCGTHTLTRAHTRTRARAQWEASRDPALHDVSRAVALLPLGFAGGGSPLAALASFLLKVDDMAHVLAWTKV